VGEDVSFREGCARIFLGNRSGQNPAHRGPADVQAAAISDLLTPARCSFHFSAAYNAAVAGTDPPFSVPPRMSKALGRSRSICRSNSAKIAGSPAICATGRCGQIQRFGERHEPDARMFQFLKGCQQVGYGPAPPVQGPDQHQILSLQQGGTAVGIGLRSL